MSDNTLFHLAVSVTLALIAASCVLLSVAGVMLLNML